MPYTTNKKITDVRKEAMRLLACGWSTRKVARHLGYVQSTIVKWSHRRNVATQSSRPKKSPKALPEDVKAAVIAKRLEVRRCAEVVHALLLREGVTVSLSSVKRICSTYCAPLKRKSPWKRTRKYPPRPGATHPGALVEMDTIHFFERGVKKYVYTALDVYSRTGFAWASPKIGAAVTVQFFKRAKKYFPFEIECIQTDNGSEFATWFTDHVTRSGVLHRHNHPRSPNENGHLERFNRTIQEEMPKEGLCFAEPKDIPIFVEWYNTKRPHLALNCKTPSEIL
jgi:transposase InsO family protein